MRAELIKLRQKINTTFIYVTHDQTEAMTLGDRIFIMKDGFIQQVGTPQEVFNHPKNLFVAGFIGTPQMNFFDGCKLLLENGTYAVEIMGKKTVLSEKQQSALVANKQQPCDITVGVRPVNMRLNEGGYAGRIEVSEMMGSELHLHMNVQDTDVVAVIPTAGLDLDAHAIGKTISFSFPPQLIHLFDRKSGENLI